LAECDNKAVIYLDWWWRGGDLQFRRALAAFGPGLIQIDASLPRACIAIQATPPWGPLSPFHSFSNKSWCSIIVLLSAGSCRSISTQSVCVCCDLDSA